MIILLVMILVIALGFIVAGLLLSPKSLHHLLAVCHMQLVTGVVCVE